MEVFRGFVLALAVATGMAKYTSLQWSDCGSDGSVDIRRIEVSPMPVMVPGDMQLTLDARLGRSLGDIDIALDIKRHTFLLDLPIPCISNVGSCTYHSTCGTQLLDTMISEGWGDGMLSNLGGQIKTMLDATIPNATTLSCPYPPMNINIQRYTLHLPEVPTILSWFAEGDYGARVVATDKASGQQLLCLHLDLTIEEPCTGLGCIFGKK